MQARWRHIAYAFWYKIKKTQRSLSRKNLTFYIYWKNQSAEFKASIIWKLAPADIIKQAKTMNDVDLN